MSVSSKTGKTGKSRHARLHAEKNSAADLANVAVQSAAVDEAHNSEFTETNQQNGSDVDVMDHGPDMGRGKTKGKNGAKGKPQRTCLVTRDVRSPDDMIRFVLSPDNIVTPDVNAKLPGRGVWITASRDLVEQAVKKNIFARGFKTSCKCPSELGAQVDEILTKFVLGTLGMARGSGALTQGFSKVDSMVRNNEAAIVLEASDGSEDGLRKIVQAVRALVAFGGDAPKIFQLFTSNQMDLALGGTNVIHLALDKKQSAGAARKRVKRLIAYRGLESVDVSPRNGSNTASAFYEDEDTADEKD